MVKHEGVYSAVVASNGADVRLCFGPDSFVRQYDTALCYYRHAKVVSWVWTRYLVEATPLHGANLYF